MLATIVTFACPKLGVRLAVEYIADLDERFAQAEFVGVRESLLFVVSASIMASVFIDSLPEVCSALIQLLTKINSP